MDRSESDLQNLTTVLQTLVNVKDAKVMSLSTSPLSGDDVLTLFWGVSNTQLQEDCAKALTLYTCSKNSTQKYYVDDPIGSREEYRGRWRNSGVELVKHGDNPGIVQKLTRGYLTALPASEEVDDEARIIGMRVDPTTGKYVVVRAWDGVDPDYVEQAVRARKALVQVVRPVAQVWVSEQHYVPDPRKGEKRFPGIYAVSDVTATPLEDGAFRVSETLTEIIQVSAITDLSAETPLATQSRETLDLFGLQPGDDDSMAFVFSKLSNDSRAACMAFTAAQLEATVLTVENVQAWSNSVVYSVGDIVVQGGINYICTKDLGVASATQPGTTAGTDFANWAVRSSFVFASSTFQEQPDNTAKFTVLFRRVGWQTWTAALANGPRVMARGNYGHEQERWELQWLGVRIADQGAAMSAAFDTLINTEPLGFNDHVTESVNCRDNGNGSFTLTIQIKEKLDHSLPAKEISRPHDFRSSTFERLRYVWEDYTLAAVNALADPTSSGYTFVSREVNGPTSTGLYSLTAILEKPTHRAWDTTIDMTDLVNPNGTMKGQNESYLAIQKADRDTAVGALDNNPSGYATQSVSVSTRGDGSIDVTRQIKVAYTASTYTQAQVQATLLKKKNQSDGRLVISVPRVIASDVSTVVAVLDTDQTVNGDTYAYRGYHDNDNGDSTHDLSFEYYDYAASVSGDDQLPFDKYTYETQTQSSPLAAGAATTDLVSPAVESYFWRIIRKKIECKVHGSGLGSTNQVNSGALAGSWNRYIGHGLWYSEKVTECLATLWQNKKYDGGVGLTYS